MSKSAGFPMSALSAIPRDDGDSNGKIEPRNHLSLPSMIKYFKFSLLFASLLCANLVVADTITGTVHNMTKGQPAAGDDVVLMRLTAAMPEAARTKTDAQGAFTLNLPSPNEQYLLRVVHEGVNYDQGVNGTGPLNIAVYDAAPEVSGLSGSIGIAQVESDGKQLKVTEMYDIVNKSKPPLTQVRGDNYVIALPAEGKFESAQVRRAQSIWLKVVPAPIKGQPGKYAIDFPIRPGETLYKITYNLPYQNAATLHLHLPYPVQKFAVMHPNSITFKALRPNSFRSPGVAGNLTVEQALGSPVVGELPPFQVSGVGSAPPHGSEGTPAAVAPPTAVQEAPPASASAPAHTVPPPTNQAAKELWLMVAGIAVLLGFLVFALWRMNRRETTVPVTAKAGQQHSAVDALKEELFQLETGRVHGSISAEEYATTKKALTESLEKALAKKDS